MVPCCGGRGSIGWPIDVEQPRVPAPALAHPPPLDLTWPTSGCHFVEGRDDLTEGEGADQ